jgi:hypothetical protein
MPAIDREVSYENEKKIDVEHVEGSRPNDNSVEMQHMRNVS